MKTYRKDYCIANGCVWRDQNGVCSRLSCNNRIVRVETVRDHIIFDTENGIKRLKNVIEMKKDYDRPVVVTKAHNTESFPKKPVIGVDNLGKEHWFESINAAARTIDVAPQNIRQGMKKNRKSGGMKWRYAEQPVHSN